VDVDQAGKGEVRIGISICDFTERFPGNNADEGIFAARQAHGMSAGRGVPVQEYGCLRCEISHCFSCTTGQ
jgi:hypothetical protein